MGILKRYIFLLLILITVNAAAENSITLYIIPPPKKLSWDSPSSITSTAFAGQIKSDYHSIGHVTAHLKCDEWQGNKSVDELTGATSQDGQSEKDMLFNQGTGLGIMFYDFKGRLEKYSDIWENLMLGRELENRLVTARFLINPASCHRTKKYLDEYRSKNLGDHYGLYLRPRHQEGAGCTAFASSVVEIAGVLNADIKSAWSKEVRVQEKFIGHPVADRNVKVNTLLFSAEAKKWATVNEAHRKLFFYDTQFMYSWLKKIWDAGMKGKWPKGYAKDEHNYKQWHQKIWVTIPAPGTIDGWEDVYVSNGVMSIVADMRSVPTPTENFWLKP